ncbi:hypothetical protein NW754_016368 [Fusarium falciforme]|nr:hypothetical protein NW754_016368 [Fusarium falciforme]
MASADDARKKRIVSHMNQDHTREISYYLRHYAHLSAGAASFPTLRDVDLNGMTIRSRDGRDHFIPFTPPLKGWGEAKDRIIEMAVEAREALGLSDVVIEGYRPPEGFGIIVTGSVIFYFFCAATLPWVQPGTDVWRLLETGFPGDLRSTAGLSTPFSGRSSGFTWSSVTFSTGSCRGTAWRGCLGSGGCGCPTASLRGSRRSSGWMGLWPGSSRRRTARSSKVHGSCLRWMRQFVWD